MKTYSLIAIVFVCLPIILVAEEKHIGGNVLVRAQILEYWVDGALASGRDAFLSWDVVHLRIEKPIRQKGAALSILIPSGKGGEVKAYWNRPGRSVEFEIPVKYLKSRYRQVDLEKVNNPKIIPKGGD